jgi:anti-sigma-K factor RskA
MIRDHERIEELLAAQVLGGLEVGDERELADARSEHGEDCAVCAGLERELSEVAGLLPFSLDPVPVDPSIADRVLALNMTAPPSVPRDQLAQRRTDRERRRSRTWTAVIGVAAAIVAALVIVSTVVPSSVEVTRAERMDQVVRFEAAPGFEGTLTMAYTPGESGAVLWGRVPDPDAGTTYEVWTFEGDAPPTSSGCASPVDGRLVLSIDGNVGTADVMAVTVESTECPPQPTTDPVLIAPLTTA